MQDLNSFHLEEIKKMKQMSKNPKINFLHPNSKEKLKILTPETEEKYHAVNTENIANSQDTDP